MSNPLEEYRAAQRRARTLFEPFTRTSCATCDTPCCRKPARVRPVDIVLVEELGYSLPTPVAGVRAVTAALVETAASGELPDGDAPCDFLQERGCAFPSDLRPFGCVALICAPMRRTLPPEELARVEDAVEDLERAHVALMAALHGQ